MNIFRRGLEPGRPFNTRLSWIAVIGVSALLFAGCSSSDGSSDTTPDDGVSSSDVSGDTGNEDSASSEDGSSGDAATPSGGTVTISLSEAPDTLDPTFAQTVGARYVFAHMCEKLYDIDEDLNVVPQLATELPQLSDDGLTATVPVRADAKFNDGTPLTAEAVAITLQRNIDAEGSARKAELGPVTNIETDGDNVVLTLDQPYAPLAAVLADRAGMIMSPDALESEGNNFGQNPVCVGPYNFVKQISGTEIDLEKSSEYYDADNVFVENLVLKPIVDATVRAQNFRSGEIDIIDRIDPADFPTLEELDNATAEKIPSVGIDVLELNTQSGPFADVNVRAAFRAAIDTEQINETVYDGLYNVTCQLFPETSPYFDTSFDCPQTGADEANRILAEAGIEGPIDVEIVMLNNPLSAQRGEIMQAQAQAAGFNVTVSPTPAAALISRASEGDFDGVILTWSGRVDPDGNSSTFLATGGGQNFGQVSNADLDALLSDAAAVADVDERKDLYSQAWRIATDEAYIVPLANPNILTARSDSINGLNMFSDGLVRMVGVSKAN